VVTTTPDVSLATLPGGGHVDDKWHWTFSPASSPAAPGTPADSVRSGRVGGRCRAEQRGWTSGWDRSAARV